MNIALPPVVYGVMYSDERNARIDRYLELTAEELLELEPHSPSDPDLLILIGKNYLKQHEFVKCYDYYSRALDADPTDGFSHLYMGNLFFFISDYDSALRHFENAKELMPDVACAYWCIADILNAQGYWSRTEEYYRKAVEVEPENADAQRRLDRWLEKRRQENAD